jgi:hypothetical protein
VPEDSADDNRVSTVLEQDRAYDAGDHSETLPDFVAQCPETLRRYVTQGRRWRAVGFVLLSLALRILLSVSFERQLQSYGLATLAPEPIFLFSQAVLQRGF